MYSRKTELVFGFHGCDESVVHSVVYGETTLKHSNNTYDWLGHGMYFWENSESRAIEWAQYLQIHPQRAKHPIEIPSVLGAVINPGYCLDLTDYENLGLLKDAYDMLIKSTNKAGFPTNKIVGENEDLLLRDLDCATIETLHTFMEDTKKLPYDSVRGVFWEGNELYPGAGFREKDHIQLCVRNPNCIKGFFIPRKLDSNYMKV